MKTAYTITQHTEDGYDTFDVCTFRADMTQAGCPVEIHLADERWDSTPIQVADGKHCTQEVARLLLVWIGLDGECYSLDEPFEVTEVIDGDDRQLD